MHDSFAQLISDTVSYLKDPLTPRQTFFATQEESVFFQKTVSLPLPQKKMQPPPPLPAPRFEPVKETQRVQVIAPVAPLPEPERPRVQPKETPDGFARVKQTLQSIAPAMKLVDEIPDDHQAKKIATAWKDRIFDVDVVLFISEKDEETLDFFKSLAKAIEKNLGKVKILNPEKLEKEKRWDLFLQNNSLRLIIASADTQKFPEMMRYYRAIPAQSEYYLDKMPLLPLLPASIYKDIGQKAHLWKTVCQILKK